MAIKIAADPSINLHRLNEADEIILNFDLPGCPKHTPFFRGIDGNHFFNKMNPSDPKSFKQYLFTIDEINKSPEFFFIPVNTKYRYFTARFF